MIIFHRQVSAVAEQTRLPPDDRQLAAFYAAQTATYGAHLATAVEAFLRTIEMGQPPDVFLAHGKFVVLSAHRIVHVGDMVHKYVHTTDIIIRIYILILKLALPSSRKALN